MAYHWSETEAEIARLGAMADAIEVAPCCDLGDGGLERCDGEPAPDCWSVYFHFPNEWAADPNGLRGCIDVADRPTLTDAHAFADELASRFGLPVHHFN